MYPLKQGIAAYSHGLVLIPADGNGDDVFVTSGYGCLKDTASADSEAALTILPKRVVVMV